MNNKAVEIRTGRIFEIGKVEPRNTGQSNEYFVFWTHDQLKTDGTPDKRVHPTMLGIRTDFFRGQKTFCGSHAPFDPTLELTAEIMRGRITNLSVQLEEAKTALEEYYATHQNLKNL